MAGTIVETVSRAGHTRKLTFACVADASDGSFPQYTVLEKFEGRLLKLVTIPGSPASVSPSPSTSPSASTSVSPSASLSPSASASGSPSASLSPSGSASFSPSASTSPSSSISPSASASPTIAAPTDNYDIRLMRRGVDLLQGLGANRDTAAREEVSILYASTSDHPSVDEADTLILVVDNHFVPSAVITIELYFGLGA